MKNSLPFLVGATPLPVAGRGLFSEEKSMSDQLNVLVRQEGKVGIAQINRPQALNALNSPTMDELVTALQAFDDDDNVGCMVLTGNERAFAAGADIKQMAGATTVTMLKSPFIGYWN